MSKYKIFKGDLFGDITATTDCYKTKSGRKCIFKCVCGETKELYASNVARKNQRNFRCKCFKPKGNNRKHGMYGTKVYRAYRNMLTRCYNQKSERYESYGGRGIGVCQRWLDGFHYFYSDMGDPPSVKFTIGRIDNDADYSKYNCRWETQEQQDYNKQDTVLLTVDGEIMTVKQASRKYGTSEELIRFRVRGGMPHKKAVQNIDHSAKYITVDGVSKRVIEWFRIAKIPISSFYYFKRKGLSESEVVKKFLDKNNVAHPFE